VYNLTIQIDSAGLTHLAALRQQVTVVKASADEYLLAWLCFPPWQVNAVSWQPTYGVYASPTALAAGERLQIGSSCAALGGNTYTLMDDGAFDGGTANLGPTEYGVSNQDPDMYIGGVAMATGGLTQAAEVNGNPGNSPVWANSIGYHQRGFFSQAETVLVLTASGIAAGTVLEAGWLAELLIVGWHLGQTSRAAVFGDVGATFGAPLTVDFATGTSQTIHFDDVANAFAPGALA
jgi:hypothetical protein